MFGEGVLYNAGLATARHGCSGCVSASEVKKASRGPGLYALQQGLRESK